MARVVIVGSNQITRHLIDWNQDADYWLFNEAAAHDWVKRVSGVFQMHAPAVWRNAANVNDAGHYDWLKQPHDFPVWMQTRYPDVPASLPYPIDNIVNRLLPNLIRKDGASIKYFTSSAAYALALAIYAGYAEIEIVGIEMASGTEYAGQLPGVLFWLGVAAGRGIEVILQPASLLMRGHLYGYEGDIVIHRQRFEIVANGLEPKLEQAKIKCFENAGKVQAVLKLLAQETDQRRANKLYADLMTAMNEKADLDFKYGILAGALAENKKYIAEVDALIQAAGGERTLQTLAAE